MKPKLKVPYSEFLQSKVQRISILRQFQKHSVTNRGSIAMSSINPRCLLNFRDAKHSLDGEAGVLAHVLSRLPDQNKWVIEFGACDGLQFSNSAHLITEQGYSAVLIEPDGAQYDMLMENMKRYPNVTCLKEFVGTQGPQRLDAILTRTTAPNNPDLMIVDVDNNDYHIFKAVESYSPKVLMIEINSTLLPDQKKVAEYDAPFVFGKHGSSIFSMTELAEAKGYSLICNISCNAVYVQEKYYSLFFPKRYSPADFYTYEGIYGERFWRELNAAKKWRKLIEAIRREWIINGKARSLGHIATHFTSYVASTAARFLRG